MSIFSIKHTKEIRVMNFGMEAGRIWTPDLVPNMSINFLLSPKQLQVLTKILNPPH